MPASGYREGIDVSHWQGNIDWVQVKGAGKSFAIVKATEGIGYKDDKYDRNKAGAMGNGLKFGAYHFARPRTTPSARRTGSSTTRTTSAGCSSRRSTSSGPVAAARPG